MKIAEISIEEQKQIDEAPAGMLGQLAKKAGAAVLGKVPGMGNVAANLKGKAEVGDTANAVYKKFSQYLGTQQKNIKTASGDDLSNFLQNTYNYNQGKIPQGILNKQQAYDVITQMAKDGYAQQGKAGTAPAGGTQGQAPGGAGGKAGAGGQGGAGAQGGPNQATTPSAKGASGAAPKSTAPAGDTIPAEIQTQIDALTPTEKKALAGMLS
jgi:hypothetical protein